MTPQNTKYSTLGGFPTMVKLTRILRDYRESGALNALININAAIGSNTFVTKSGDLVVFLGIQGIDDECLDAAEIDQVAHRYEAAVRVFDERFRIYQYLVKRDQASIPSR